MRHVLYEGDVHPDEPVTALNAKPLYAVREKTADGRYRIVLTDEAPAAAESPKKGSK